MQKKRARWTFLVVLFVLSIVILAAGCARERVTLTNYQRITQGMTLAECEKILGKGTSMAGVRLTAQSIEMVRWTAKSGGYIDVGFVDGEVFNKAQVRLSP